MARPKKDPKTKHLRFYTSIPIYIAELFPSPTHIRLYAENALKTFNPNINNIPKPPKLNNFKANQALQKFIKNSNNPI